jgi:hypothetical protein
MTSGHTDSVKTAGRLESPGLGHATGRRYYFLVRLAVQQGQLGRF